MPYGRGNGVPLQLIFTKLLSSSSETVDRLRGNMTNILLLPEHRATSVHKSTLEPRCLSTHITYLCDDWPNFQDDLDFDFRCVNVSVGELALEVEHVPL